MAVTISGDTGISAVQAGAVESGDLPAGSLIQVVHNQYGTDVTSSSSTFIDTGLSASITPTKASSKILVLVEQNGCRKSPNVISNSLDIELLYQNSVLVRFAGALAQTGDASENVVSSGLSYLHSPNTTSAVNYKTQFRSRNDGNSVSVQYASVSVSAITLMEIAG